MSTVNTLNAELNPICCLLALLGAHHFLRVSRIRVKSLTLISRIRVKSLTLINRIRVKLLTLISRIRVKSLTHDLSRRAACDRWPAEIVGSNPTGGMDICLL